MADAELVRRTFSARLDCHYLLRVPPGIDSHSVLVVALHGFGSNAETMMELTAKMFGPSAAIASMQGPNQFFLPGREREVGYGWITSRDAQESIRLHREMVLHVLEEAAGQSGIPRERRVLAGFSQAVGLNYRLAATCPEAVRGVVGICGGLPGDWDDGPYQPVQAAVLHIATREDRHYPPEVTEHYAERLRRRAADVEFHLVEGGHRIPSVSASILANWLKRVIPISDT